MSVATRIRQAINDTNSTYYTDNDLIDAINEAQRFLYKNVDFYVKTYELDLVEDQYEYDLSSVISDLLSFVQFKHHNTVLDFKSLSEMEAISGNWEENEGAQLYYIVLGVTDNWNKIRVYPIPTDTEYQLKIIYKRTPTDISSLSDSLDIIPMHQDFIIYYASWLLLTISRNPLNLEKINIYEKKYLRELRLLKKQTDKNFVDKTLTEISYRTGV